jgi:hypothetical protein
MGKTLYTESSLMIIMGRLDLNISDQLEQKFRDMVYKTKGMKKGNLTISLEEALDLWITEQARKRANQK